MRDTYESPLSSRYADKEMKYIFFGAWLTAAATIDNSFESKGAMMTFVIAMLVIIATAWSMGKEK